MENSTFIAPGSWQWKSGTTQNYLQYLPACGEIPATFTWVEETAPAEGESGSDSRVESTQTLADFLEKGPSLSPPVEIVEAILTHVQVENPAWFEAYRLHHPVSAQESPEEKEVLEKCASACARTGWSFLGELVFSGMIEGAALLLDA